MRILATLVVPGRKPTMHRSKSRPVWIWIVAIALLAPLGYVLSFGPAVRWMNRGEAPETVETVLSVIYAPLNSVMELPFVGEALLAYVVLWVEPEVAWEDVLRSSSSREAAVIGDSEGVVRIGIDFDGQPGTGESTATISEGDASGVLSGSRVILTGATQEASARSKERRDEDADETIERRLVSDPGETTVAHSHASHTFPIAAPTAGRFAEDAIPALIVKGDTPVKSMQTDGANPEWRANTLSLENARLTTPDGLAVFQSNRATVSELLVEGSRTAVREVKLHLTGNVEWKGAGCYAKAGELSFSLQPAAKGESARVSGMTLSRSVHIKAPQATGEADRIEIEFDPKSGFSADSPTRILLKGHGALSMSGKSGLRGGIEGARIDYFPLRDTVTVDRSEATK
jgi:hypothetical protein